MVNYEIRQSNKAKRVSITVYPDLRIVVTKPTRVPEFVARNFVARKRSWIEKRIKFYSSREITKLGNSRGKTKSETVAFVKSRLEFFNQHYGFRLGRVSIKNQKSLWGSCSRLGNLNFNHKIVDLPAEQADYIIVHELCHLKEFNHSKKFWNLVGEMIPNYRALKAKLKNYSFS